MATLTPKNWQLSSYTSGTWTDLVAETSVIHGINIANTDVAGISIEIRRVNSSGTEIARLQPAVTIAAGDSKRFAGIITVMTGKIQVKAAAAGIHFDANGYVDA